MFDNHDIPQHCATVPQEKGAAVCMQRLFVNVAHLQIPSKACLQSITRQLLDQGIRTASCSICCCCFWLSTGKYYKGGKEYTYDPATKAYKPYPDAYWEKNGYVSWFSAATLVTARQHARQR